MTVRIAMWSGPRNISTAMMRSFGARADCCVSDEPFYGAYLKQSGEPQPMADEIIASMDCDWDRVAFDMNGSAPERAAIWYQKHMPHHMIDDVTLEAFPNHKHAFLIREPARVIASYANKRVSVKFDDLRYDRQLDYFRKACQMAGSVPPVVESTKFLTNPEGHLKALCLALDISWHPSMLKWNTGIQETDGIWASHWYDQVAASTEFGAPSSKLPVLSDSALKLAEKCQPYFDEMKVYALTAIQD